MAKLPGDTSRSTHMRFTCCGPLPAALQLVREAEVALGAQAAGQRRHCFRLPAAAAPRAVAAALNGCAAAAAATAARWRCRVDCIPQAAGVEAASSRVFDVPASGDPASCPSCWHWRTLRRLCAQLNRKIGTSTFGTGSTSAWKSDADSLICPHEARDAELVRLWRMQSRHFLHRTAFLR
jgi:hypothetical protein